MAKKSASGNKSQAIREALAANPDASPKQIAEKVNKQGFKATPAYVSIVKYNQSKASGKAGRKVRVKRAGKGAALMPIEVRNGFAPMQTALDFITACGGLDQAKAVLAQVETIRAVV
ncbi:hypothetical protein Pan44_37350 [Caulifigura coniformis]|uniref:Uncharacterized protein n=1 Tax=Caulifigura coniformis TaxID=2527983 RepID=A0A517SHU0_9PLAN|nr:hypothetical protein [Caulifigura coniformis]QDT55689.1 hypothetical protein Pan44_37350 [Caulifigura coniformis]